MMMAALAQRRRRLTHALEQTTRLHPSHTTLLRTLLLIGLLVSFLLGVYDFATSGGASHFIVVQSARSEIAVVMFGQLEAANQNEWFESNVVAAVQTYLQNFAVFYVVDRTFQLTFEELCTQPANSQACSGLTPLYVDCGGLVRRDSTCCRHDQALANVGKHYPNYKWYLLLDEGTYVRTPFFMNFVAGLSPSQPVTLAFKNTSSPVRVALGNNNNDGGGGRRGRGNGDSGSSSGTTWDEQQQQDNTLLAAPSCENPSFRALPMELPLVYSRAALVLLRRGFGLGGIQSLCRTMGLRREVSSAVFHWQYGLREILLPTMAPPDSHLLAIAKSQTTATTTTSTTTTSSALHRVYQTHLGFLQVLGHSAVHTNVSSSAIHALHEAVREMPFPEQTSQYSFHVPRGFPNTSLYQNYGHPTTWMDKWHAVPAAECRRIAAASSASTAAADHHNGGSKKASAAVASVRLLGTTAANKGGKKASLDPWTEVPLPAPPTVAFITFGNYQNVDFQHRLRDILETYLTSSAQYRVYVVLQEGDIRAFEKHCTADCHKLVTPLYVDCSESLGPDGEAACCKQDVGLSTLWYNFPKYDWYVFFDSFTYFRTAALSNFLAGLLSRDQPVVLTPGEPKRLGVTWGPREHQTKCSSLPAYKYPVGRPVIYNQAAMNLLVPSAFVKQAVQLQCSEFLVPYDSANAIVHWMSQLTHITLPLVDLVPQRPLRHNDTEYAIGYLSVGHLMYRTIGMQELHSRLQAGRGPVGPYTYESFRPMGYVETETYAEIGRPESWQEVWNTFPASDCVDYAVRARRKAAASSVRSVFDWRDVNQDAIVAQTFLERHSQIFGLPIAPTLSDSTTTSLAAVANEASTNTKTETGWIWDNLDIFVVGVLAIQIFLRGRMGRSNSRRPAIHTE